MKSWILNLLYNSDVYCYDEHSLRGSLYRYLYHRWYGDLVRYHK